MPLFADNDAPLLSLDGGDGGGGDGGGVGGDGGGDVCAAHMHTKYEQVVPLNTYLLPMRLQADHMASMLHCKHIVITINGYE